MVLEWRAGAQNVLLDALSRLPHIQNPQSHVDDSFPDDFTSGASSEFVGPWGASLDGVRLTEVYAVGGDGADGNGSLSDAPLEPSTHNANEACFLALRALPLGCVLPCLLRCELQTPLQCAAEAGLVLLPYGYVLSVTSSCLPWSTWRTRGITAPACPRRSSQPLLRHRPRHSHSSRSTPAVTTLGRWYLQGGRYRVQRNPVTSWRDRPSTGRSR